jgi:hypothetical protein
VIAPIAQEDAMVSAHHLPTLTTLIDGCKRGDSNAWIDFDRQVRPPVERALAKRLGHWVNTADLVSEVIEAMWQNDMKRLRAIDPRRGRVINFLTSVGVQLWRQGLRFGYLACEAANDRHGNIRAAIPARGDRSVRSLPIHRDGSFARHGVILRATSIFARSSRRKKAAKTWEAKK